MGSGAFHPPPRLLEDVTRRRGPSVLVASDTHADPGLVAGHVVDAVRNSLPARVARKIVDAHRVWLARRLPFPPMIPEVPDQLLLLGVDRDDRLPARQEPSRRGIDVLELCVAVGVRGSFLTFAQGLQAVPQSVEEAADGRRTHPPPVARQRGRQLRATLTHVHRRGDVGSPRVTGSTSASRAAVMPG